MNDHLSRRNMISRAGLAIGGAIALRALPSCGAEDSEPEGGNASTGPQVKDFPYEPHLKATYRIDAATVKELAYHFYYAGGCCHGSYRGILEHLSLTAGAPFNLMPLDFGKFGGGGIAGFGSICGALLGSVLIINSIVIDPDARTAMMTDLLRWYETAVFPNYIPIAVDAAEKDLTKDFSAGNIATLQDVAKAHLCHSSVSGWCATIGVPANGPDKKARCARLTADVAGKAAEMINSYLETKTYKAAAPDAVTAGCIGCHTAASTTKPVQANLTCGTCHTNKLSGHP